MARNDRGQSVAFVALDAGSHVDLSTFAGEKGILYGFAFFNLLFGTLRHTLALLLHARAFPQTLDILRD